MQLFIDSGNVDEIRQAYEWGILDGITTNPSLVAKTGKKFKDVVDEILSFFPGVLNLEVIATEKEPMLKEAHTLAKIGKNTVVKLPTTVNGIAVAKELAKDDIRTNLTLCFSIEQALLVAKVDAFYVSPFVGRLDDIGQNGMNLIRDIVTVYKNYDFKTQVLVASVRNVEHVRQSMLLGAHIATCPFKILEELYKHELTDKGLKKFLEDWKASDQQPLT